jgi:hypothetical protein
MKEHSVKFATTYKCLVKFLDVAIYTLYTRRFQYVHYSSIVSGRSFSIWRYINACYYNIDTLGNVSIVHF